MFGVIYFVLLFGLQFIAPTWAQLPANGSLQCGRLNESQLYNRDTLTALDEYPWLGRVTYMDGKGERSYRCLAVLFNARHALIPAHCLIRLRDLNAYSVLFGDWNATDDVMARDCNALGECAAEPQEYLIEEIAIHPDFDQQHADNDIAVLRLAQDVSFTPYVQPICLLPPAEVAGGHIGLRLEVVGFPASTLFSKQKVRSKAQGQTTSIEHCSGIYSKNFPVTENQICAYINGENIFMSGSAIMGINVVNGEPKNFYLVGITTKGSFAKNGSVPDLFMRIWPYRNWILNNS